MLYNIVIAYNTLYEKTRTNFEYGTFIDGEGLWKGEFENTKIFYIEVPDSEAIATSVLLKHIADRYRKAFRQESVLVSEVSTQTTFV